jgi:hypothetical protein
MAVMATGCNAGNINLTDLNNGGGGTSIVAGAGGPAIWPGILVLDGNAQSGSGIVQPSTNYRLSKVSIGGSYNKDVSSNLSSGATYYVKGGLNAGH